MRVPTKQELADLRDMARVYSSLDKGGSLSKGRAWLDDVIRASDKCHEWPVQNLTDCCGGCPAGGYDVCLVSPLDARVKAVNIGGPAPDGCPLREGGSVLLTGES
jgi:hypothetical protein